MTLQYWYVLNIHVEVDNSFTEHMLMLSCDSVGFFPQETLILSMVIVVTRVVESDFKKSNKSRIPKSF